MPLAAYGQGYFEDDSQHLMRVVESYVATEDDTRKGDTSAIDLEYAQFITMCHFCHWAILSL